MRQKSVSTIVQHTTIWFRRIQPKTERKPRAMPFVSFLYGSVPFVVRYRARSPSAAFFAEESQARWSTFRGPDALSCSRPPPHDYEKPWGVFFKSGCGPQTSRVQQSLLAQSRHINETKRNNSLGKTKRYRRRKRQTKRTIITFLRNGTGNVFDSYCMYTRRLYLQETYCFFVPMNSIVSATLHVFL